MNKKADRPINLKLNSALWHAFGVVCAKLGLQKREAVSRAITEYIERNDPESLQFLNGKIPD